MTPRRVLAGTRKAFVRGVDIALTLIVVMMLVCLVVTWPTRFGGSSTVVFVAGNSMEPTYSSEDIVIARQRDHLAVGDVIVYRIPGGRVAGTLIVHRITGGDGTQGFTMKGDNNATADRFRPTSNDVVGKVWIHAGNGHLLRSGLRLALTPWLWAVFGMLVTFVVTWRIIVARDERHAS